MVFRVSAPGYDEEENAHDTTPLQSSSDKGFNLLSHEIIEQRLENLKRRDRWIDWLNSQVNEWNGIDDDEDVDWQPFTKDFDAHCAALLCQKSGFLRHLCYSIIGISLSPVLLILSLWRSTSTWSCWPLGYKSPLEWILKSYLNLATLVSIVTFTYWTICEQLPQLDMESIHTFPQYAMMYQNKIRFHVDNLRQVKPIEQMPIDSIIAISEVFLICLYLYMLTKFYRSWTRIVLLISYVTHLAATSQYMQSIISPMPQITSFEPSFALVNEEIVISVKGSNLEQGAIIAWEPYYGCFDEVCQRQYASKFLAGNVHVTFNALEQFIPCYKSPPNPIRAPDFHCFPSLILRVKDEQSIPGWSMKSKQSLVPVKHNVIVNVDGQVTNEQDQNKH